MHVLARALSSYYVNRSTDLLDAYSRAPRVEIRKP
ncbi:hypothetical protein LPJ38_20565 [Bradyrhizobium daqingense]|nr:hypothetical protein [Bradyrhizobium daqingense]UFS92802.1 hypothetical protein LPJ38_20565 [Bradyrhizobium daqingense]